MFIVVTLTYPLIQSKKIGALFTSGKLPDASPAKLEKIMVVSDGDIKVYAIYEVPNDKVYEGIKTISARYAGYLEVEDFKYKLEPTLSAEEALPMIGL